MSYKRKATTYEEQIDILKSRGLIIEDEDEAVGILRSIGYFRLKGYCLSLYKPGTENFKPSTSVKRLQAIYQFDNDLRGVTMRACQRAEVRLKAAIGMTLALEFGPILPVAAFDDPKKIEAWNGKVRDAHAQGDSRKEAYVRHYLDDYKEFPIWVDLELSTLGNVSKLFSWLNSDMKKKIAEEYSVRDVYLKNWVHILTVVRNICAHSSRFYGRFLPLAYLIPGKYRDYFQNRTYFATVFVLSHLLTAPEFENYFDNLKAVTDEYSDTVNLGLLGFQEDWYRRVPLILKDN